MEYFPTARATLDQQKSKQMEEIISNCLKKINLHNFSESH